MKLVLKAYWRQLLPIAAALLSILCLVVPGILYLVERDWFIWWAMGFGAVALIVLGALRLCPAPVLVSSEAERAIAQHDLAWNPTEEAAWKQVVLLGEEIASSPPASVDDIREMADRTLVTVAKALHPNNPFAAAHFTLPDVLLALETGARELRAQVVQTVPGSDILKISHLQGLQAAREKYGSGLKALVWAYRMVRLYTNPAGGAIAELRSYFQDKGVERGTQELYGRVCRELVLKLGRLAIDLYGGRLRANVDVLKQSVIDSSPETAQSVPVRLLISGQVNAGKSSLVNALSEDVLAAVSELPATPGQTEYRSEVGVRQGVVLVDTKGLDGSASSFDAWSKSAQKCDLIVWVASAANPAREVDRKAMESLSLAFQDGSRPRPKLVLVASHIDQLPPRREWSPPYNVEEPSTSKEVSIREAMRALMGALGNPDAPCVPVVLRPDAPTYNLDTLWSVIEGQLPDAQRVSLRRALDARSGTSLKRVATQVAGAATALGKLFLRADPK